MLTASHHESNAELPGYGYGIGRGFPRNFRNVSLKPLHGGLMPLMPAHEKERLPVNCKMNDLSRIFPITLAMLVLSGCGGQGVCDDAEVLKTVRNLYAQQILGQFIEPPEGAFTPQVKSATLASVDKQSNITKCSTLVRADYVVLAKMVQKATDKELRENAAKKGMATFEDFLVSYQVQPLASGHNYVTLLQGGN